jgi:methylglutaconyl-CoA hydratase
LVKHASRAEIQFIQGVWCFAPAPISSEDNMCVSPAQEETFQSISLRVDASGVAHLALNRPEVHNAFNEAMSEELTRCFRLLSSSDAVRLVVLSSNGSVFCAGADLAWMRRASENGLDANHQDATRFADMMRAIHGCTKPVIARVNGGAFGGGVGLICACDIVVASDKAKFAVTEARFGILPAVIGPYLIESVGVREARRLALTASPVNALEAQRIGLVHFVTMSDSLDEQLQTLLSELGRNGRTALQEIKGLFNSISARPIDEEVIKLTASTIARVRSTDEATEGFAAFFDKRRPSWSSQ